MHEIGTLGSQASTLELYNWETIFYPVLVLGRVALSTMRVPNSSPILDLNCASIGPETVFSSAVGARVGGMLLALRLQFCSVLDEFQSVYSITCNDRLSPASPLESFTNW